MTPASIETEAHPTKAIPHLPAANLKATRDWYVRYLGFRAHEHLRDFLILERGSVVLHFYLSNKPGATDVGTLYLNVEGDIDALCIRMRADGAVAENDAPTDQNYGKREFTARDPDGRPVFIGKPI
jgi:catechol 2,3-dioxygenase-like lactoylglutathione lyase family enzyme